MSTPRRFGSLTNRLLCTAILWLATGASAAGQPNVLLITIDTLRADHCSILGYANETTPALRRLADAGALFETAYAPTSETAPTHASIFTGQYPTAHGLIKNGLALPEGHETLAETLLASGYQTAGFVSSFVLDGKFGWGRGFGSYHDDFDPASGTMDMKSWEGHEVAEVFDQRGDVTTRAVMRWLWERDRGRPFFLFVHYMDPHSPYSPPSEFEQRFELPEPGPAGSVKARFDWRALVRRYDGEIAFADQQIGRLLDGLDREGLTDDTIVVVTADHGEGLMDHGVMIHGLNVYEESVLVPLVFRWPGKIAAGQRHSEPVELVDLAASIRELAGVEHQTGPVPTGDTARERQSPARPSLAGALREGKSLDSDRPVFLYRRPFPDTYADGIHVNGDQYGIRVGRWKYILGEEEHRRELYDLDRDPSESENVISAHPEVVEDLQARIERFKRDHASTAPVPTVSEQDRKGLEALGYSVD